MKFPVFRKQERESRTLKKEAFTKNSYQMKKLDLKLGSIKELLSKEQMKKVVGGYYSIPCECIDINTHAVIASEVEDCDDPATCNDQCKSFCAGFLPDNG